MPHRALDQSVGSLAGIVVEEPSRLSPVMVICATCRMALPLPCQIHSNVFLKYSVIHREGSGELEEAFRPRMQRHSIAAIHRFEQKGFAKTRTA
jgi:hypothetical protein